MSVFSVRSFGTEDRPTERPIAPRDEVYEYIIFRGPDIKDIRVCQPPKPQPLLDGGLANDPAIVHHSASANAAAGSRQGPSHVAPVGVGDVQNGPKPGQPFGQAGESALGRDLVILPRV